MCSTEIMLSSVSGTLFLYGQTLLFWKESGYTRCTRRGQERIRTGDLSKSVYLCKFETGQTLLPVLKIVTHCAHCIAISHFVNPRPACVRRVTIVVLCVCVSVFYILPSHTFRRAMRGISSYSTGNAVKLKSQNCLVQKFEAL